MIHDLKIRPVYFEAVEDGRKTFEIRYDDRDYQVGDRLILREWHLGRYTGRVVEKMVTYKLTNCVGIYENYCILGIK